MTIDRNKKRLVFLGFDEIVNLSTLAQMHIDANGAPRPLQVYPVSEEWVQSLKKAVEILDKAIGDISNAEEDRE